MSKFRSKPVEVEAFQLTKEYVRKFWTEMTQPRGMGFSSQRIGASMPDEMVCHSRQGIVSADFNDWIIEESDGSGCYPCKPDVFAAKYEPI